VNLSEALDAALPEIPQARLTRTRPPCLDPDLIVRPDTFDGEPIVGVLKRGKSNFFRFPPGQWELALLFDGVRSYDEIATLYTEKTGQPIHAGEVHAFALHLDQEEFWYQSPQEKNIALSEKLRAQRSRLAGRKSKINLAHISFTAWDPDRYLGWLDRSIGRFIYNPWSVTVLLVLFLFQAFVYVAKWKTMGPDILLFFNFGHKSIFDLAEFWVLFLMLGFFHETAHGLTCKHFGGEVHSMGFMFLYLAPCFFVDVTESWVSANRTQRLFTIIAGIWVEMTICSVAMIVWMNTLAGQWLHDFAYEIILLTGIAVIAINLNPLIKLDGYYFLTECIGLPDLKERSTAFLSGWFQGHILRLPVEVPVVPRRRVALFVLYAVASGLYSYLLLFTVVRFTYNIASNWLAEFALIPAGALAYGLFGGRLSSLRETASRVWARNFADGFHWRPFYVLAALALLVIVFVPLWRDRENAYFVVEPDVSTTVHAAVPGKIDAVLVHEGEQVHAGQPLLHMTSSTVASIVSAAAAQTRAAQFQAFNAQVRRESIGAAASSQDEAAHVTNLAHTAQSALLLTAPADGIVLTRDPSSLLNQDVASGQPLIALAEAGPRIARIFVPASALNRVPQHAEIALAPAGRFSIIRLQLASMEGEAVTLPPGLVPDQDYKGIVLPTFYWARIPLPASDDLLPIGSAGQAKIFGKRHSLFQRTLTVVLNLFHAHVW
jgi:putative peptide zinc metalloprotease protein